MSDELRLRVVLPDPKRKEFWQCPQCRARFWTLQARDKLNCDSCSARAVPISMSSYMKPDGYKPSDRAYVSASEVHVDY